MAIIKVRNPAIDLDAAEIPNIDASKITSGSLGADRIPGLAASKITTGTFADARIAASNVSQHATSFDDNKIVNDISTLALRQASDQNKSAYNTNSQSVDVFQDDTGIDVETNTDRNASEYVSSIQTVQTTSSITLNSSNYQTYMDITDDDFMSVMKRTSGLSDLISTEQTNNTNFGNGSVYENNNTITNAMEADLAGFIFASNASSSQYRIQNTDTSDTYRLIYVNFKLKNNVTFKPNGTVSFNARNGTSGWADVDVYGVTSGLTQTNLITIPTPNGVESGTISNSTFFPRIGFRMYHTQDQYPMLDDLSIAGDVSAPVITVNATGNFTGTTITAPSSVSSMGAIITYQDNAGTNALNTDIVLQLSADGGSNYSTATLTALPDFSTGIKMAKVNDLAVTAGTQLKYKINFANQASGSKEARIRGVALQY